MHPTQIITTAMLMLAAALASSADAQKTVNVSGTYTYHAPLTMSVAEARLRAAEYAKVEALANKFGTLVIQRTATSSGTASSGTSEDFRMVSSSDVRGEWLSDTRPPVFIHSITDYDHAVVATVEGVAREIASAPIDLDIKALRHQPELYMADTEFNDGDAFYLYFRTPIDGYVAVYMLDQADGTVYQMLPYRNSDDTCVKVKAVNKDEDGKNVPYIFFSPMHASPYERSLVEEYYMTTDDPTSWSDIYVLFSKKPLSKPITEIGLDGIKLLKADNFQKWLGKARSSDIDLNVSVIPLHIVNPNSKKH